MPVSSKEILDIQAIIQCGFTLKRVRDIITYRNKVPPKDQIFTPPDVPGRGVVTMKL